MHRTNNDDRWQWESWNRVRELAEQVGRDRFGPALIGFLDAAIAADDCVVIIQNARNLENVLDETRYDKRQFDDAMLRYTDRYGDSRRRIVTRQMPCRSALIECHRMVIDQIETKRFRREFYYDLGVVDHIWCRAPYHGAVISLSAFRRSSRGPFRHEQLEHFTDLLPMLIPLIICHTDLTPSRLPQDETPLDKAARFAVVNGVRLAPRETQVCALILEGHTNLGISLHLGISENTVRTLRQRAYAKLGISTMGELFTLLGGCLPQRRHERGIRGRDCPDYPSAWLSLGAHRR